MSKIVICIVFGFPIIALSAAFVAAATRMQRMEAAKAAAHAADIKARRREAARRAVRGTPRKRMAVQ